LTGKCPVSPALWAGSFTNQIGWVYRGRSWEVIFFKYEVLGSPVDTGDREKGTFVSAID